MVVLTHPAPVKGKCAQAVHKVRTAPVAGIRNECIAPIPIQPRDWPSIVDGEWMTLEQHGVMIRLVLDFWRNQVVPTEEYVRIGLDRMNLRTARRINLPALIKIAEGLISKRAAIDQKTRELIAEAAGFKCHYCGVNISGGYHIDHAQPVARGGKNADENYRATCKPCNLTKRTMTEVEFFAFLAGQAEGGESA